MMLRLFHQNKLGADNAPRIKSTTRRRRANYIKTRSSLHPIVQLGDGTLVDLKTNRVLVSNRLFSLIMRGRTPEEILQEASRSRSLAELGERLGTSATTAGILRRFFLQDEELLRPPSQSLALKELNRNGGLRYAHSGTTIVGADRLRKLSQIAKEDWLAALDTMTEKERVELFSLRNPLESTALNWLYKEGGDQKLDEFWLSANRAQDKAPSSASIRRSASDLQQAGIERKNLPTLEQRVAAVIARALRELAEELEKDAN